MSAQSNKVYRQNRVASGLPAVDPVINATQYQKRKAAGKIQPLTKEQRDKFNARRRELRKEHRSGLPVIMGKPKTNFLSPQERRLIKNQKAREKRAAMPKTEKYNRPKYAGRPVYSKEERRLQKNAKAATYRSKKEPVQTRPAARTYNRKSKPEKKIPAMVIPKDDPEKIKVRLSPRLEVMARPGYDLQQLRDKYGVKNI